MDEHVLIYETWGMRPHSTTPWFALYLPDHVISIDTDDSLKDKALAERIGCTKRPNRRVGDVKMDAAKSLILKETTVGRWIKSAAAGKGSRLRSFTTINSGLIFGLEVSFEDQECATTFRKLFMPVLAEMGVSQALADVRWRWLRPSGGRA
ncbi:hypothetical protein A9D14_17515 (plasmid) [Croceicoccus marinus]|nr:hypothetical protein A9D14_17515 [Croceicoccus marinus]